MRDFSERMLGWLHRLAGSGWTHAGFACIGSVLLWVARATDVYLWAFAVVGLAVLLPVFAVAGIVAVWVDCCRDVHRTAHAVVGCCHAVFALQFGWHLWQLLHTRFGC